MWTLGLHGGARFPMGGTSVLTPYLNLDYVHAKMDEFIESGRRRAPSFTWATTSPATPS